MESLSFLSIQNTKINKYSRILKNNGKFTDEEGYHHQKFKTHPELKTNWIFIQGKTNKQMKFPKPKQPGSGGWKERGPKNNISALEKNKISKEAI